MNKFAALFLSLLTAAVSVSAQEASDVYKGFYGGVQVGYNRSKATGDLQQKRSTIYPGLVAGYNHFTNNILLGVEAFADFHHGSTTYKDGGAGVRVGTVLDKTLLFARVGATGTWPSWRPQLGLGAEYMINQDWGLTGLITHDRSTDHGIRRTNTSLAVGVNYHLR